MKKPGFEKTLKSKKEKTNGGWVWPVVIMLWILGSIAAIIIFFISWKPEENLSKTQKTFTNENKTYPAKIPTTSSENTLTLGLKSVYCHVY